ncbi:DUF2683 family protein [Mucilaginibacter sp. OK098]|uniref:DUF2683 family protein n=1 Tax=Mucilaginibacter sp. OK098 TaxID=1855297 RepID=UPI000918F5CE|nr:DUF2683 family protein [Mucilaginibacter sp. OK098]SHN37273.1 hypothetical protein SAMN05216524_11519 [Mucilaginibacter sp. OK098]
MSTLIIHPENKQQLNALKGLMKAFKIPFEVSGSAYDPEFVTKIEMSREQVKRGETRVVSEFDIKNIFVEKIEKGFKDIEDGRVLELKEAKQKFLK